MLTSILTASDGHPPPNPVLRAAGSSSARSRKTRPIWVRCVRIALFVYFGLLTVLYALQTRAIFPGGSTQGQPHAQVRPRPGAELVTLATSQGERVVALFASSLLTDGRPDPEAANRPTMLYFYGNAMCLNDSTDELERFRRLGLNVICPDYVGYGMSGGSPSEEGCRATALAAYEYLISTRGTRPNLIISAGWSIGGAVAIDLASLRQVGGLIAFSSFTSAVDLGRRVLPFIPVSILLRHRFESIRKIAQITCPVLISHGRLDPIVPFAMGEALAATVKGPLTTLWIDQAEHNDFYYVGGKRLDEAIALFARQIAAP
jgi:pimeloyl-ACP methyl ester carboxylesterase